MYFKACLNKWVESNLFKPHLPVMIYQLTDQRVRLLERLLGPGDQDVSGTLLEQLFILIRVNN